MLIQCCISSTTFVAERGVHRRILVAGITQNLHPKGQPRDVNNGMYFLEVNGAVLLIAAIVLGSLISKFTSGWIGGRIVGFTSSQSLLVGASTIPQLSTTLAVVFTAAALGLLDQELITALVVLSTVSTFIGPPLIQMFSRRITKDTDISESQKVPATAGF